jgi:cytochrome P450
VDKLISNAEILIIGGSETTATLLSGVTYLLLKNPGAYRTLTGEVRSTFNSEEEINLVSVTKLRYMLACLDEALRMYPPVANGLPRVCPKGGAEILGAHIPERVCHKCFGCFLQIALWLIAAAQTYVSIHQWALYRRDEYFTDPNNFHPERFLSDPRFLHDRRDMLQPFHVGPRNCLGRKYVARS